MAGVGEHRDDLAAGTSAHAMETSDNGAAASPASDGGSLAPAGEGDKNKWGLASLLSRGRSDAPHDDEPPSQKQKGGWFGTKRRNKRPGSADSASSQQANQRTADVPIVGGFPLVLGSVQGASVGDIDDISLPGISLERRPSTSAPASAFTSPAEPELLSLPAETITAPTHRRHRSLLGSLGLGKPPKGPSAANSGDLDAASGGGSKHSDGPYSCPGIDALEVEPLPLLPDRPPVGISNVGNTCFMSAALQCLRYTPGLAAALIPDLMERAEAVKKAAEEAMRKEAAEDGDGGENAGAAGQKEAGAAQQQDSGVYTDLRSRLESLAGSEGPSVAIAAQGAAVEDIDNIEGSRRSSSSGTALEAIREAEVVGEEQAAAAATAEDAASDAAKQQQQSEEKSSAAEDDSSAEGEQQPPPPPKPKPLPQQRPPRGELSAALSAMFLDLFVGDGEQQQRAQVNPQPLLEKLRRFPIAVEYFDGRQQDCQEMLQVLLDLVHEDLNRVAQALPQAAQSESSDGRNRPLASTTPPAVAGEEEEGAAAAISSFPHENGGKVKEQPAPPVAPSSPNGLPPKPPKHPLEEAAKAEQAWEAWRKTSDSPVSDLFMGQLQSSVLCSKCGGRFTMYEPCTGLSLPLAPKSGGTFSWLGLRPGGPLTLQDCLRAFTAEEKLEGGEAFHCEACGVKTQATKHLRLHRLPPALVLHIKRFRHRGAGSDKLAADVAFPLRGLDLSGHLSPESPHPPEACCYDLYAVSYHTGASAAGGHYTACCRVGDDAWWAFNDENVSSVGSGSSVKSQNAYILFYVRRQFKDPTAAAIAFAEAARAAAAGAHKHKHSRSRSGSGSGFFSTGGKNKDK